MHQDDMMMQEHLSFLKANDVDMDNVNLGWVFNPDAIVSKIYGKVPFHYATTQWDIEKGRFINTMHN